MASDIDFDELDRAVNSLLGGKDDTPTATTTSVDSKPTQVVPPANRRSNGRFMDIRSTGKPAPSQGLSASPSAPAATSSSMPAPVEPPKLDLSAPQAAAPSSNDWPDPIDFMSNQTPSTASQTDQPKPDDTQPKTETNEAANEPAIGNLAPADDMKSGAQSVPDLGTDEISDADEGELSPVEPLNTPFLPDTKVEKRPLGSFASPMPGGASGTDLMDHRDEVKLDVPMSTTTPDADKPADAVAPVDTTSDSSDSQPETPTTPVVDSDTPMPAELQGDVLSLESDEIPVPTTPAVPVSAVTPTASVSAAAPVSTEGAPMSIVQQYREKASTATPASGAIYDTEAYHKPLTPKKKSSKNHGLVITLWVIALIIVGAGVGAAVYYFVLPLLG